jgi:hypothetical protein
MLLALLCKRRLLLLLLPVSASFPQFFLFASPMNDKHAIMAWTTAH